MVAMEKEKAFLLDAAVLPSEFFGTSVEAVVGKFKEATARSAAFKMCIPQRSEHTPRQFAGPFRFKGVRLEKEEGCQRGDTAETRPASLMYLLSPKVIKSTLSFFSPEACQERDRVRQA